RWGGTGRKRSRRGRRRGRRSCAGARGRTADYSRRPRLSWPAQSLPEVAAMFNRTALAVVIIAVAAGLGLVAAQRFFNQAEVPSQWPATTAVRRFEPARELPALSRRQSDGTALLPGGLHGPRALAYTA